MRAALPPTDEGHPSHQFYTYAQCIEMNLAYAHRMLKAREKGLETFTLGPKKDDTAFSPTYFPRLPQGSLIRSAAILCVEFGDSEIGAAPRRFGK